MLHWYPLAAQLWPYAIVLSACRAVFEKLPGILGRLVLLVHVRFCAVSESAACTQENRKTRMLVTNFHAKLR